MTIPLLALAGCTILIGLFCLLIGPFFGGPTEWFAGHLEKTLGFEALGHADHAFSWMTAILGTLVGVAGIGLSYYLYGQGKAAIPLGPRIRPLYEASLNKFYVDEIYQGLIVKPLRGLAIVCEFLDIYLVDGLVTGVASLPRWIGRRWLSGYQNGLIQFYAAVSAASVALLLVVLILLQLNS
jgi:NADH-quinone oxidoreductase subunit L